MTGWICRGLVSLVGYGRKGGRGGVLVVPQSGGGWGWRERVICI